MMPAVQEIWVWSLGQEDPLEKGMTTHSNILPGGFHGQRSLAGYSPSGCKELDTTERLTHSDDNALIRRQNLERVKVAQHQAVRAFKSKREDITEAQRSQSTRVKLGFEPLSAFQLSSCSILLFFLSWFLTEMHRRDDLSDALKPEVEC